MAEKLDEKVKRKKRSRHWDDVETKILISKWAEDNIQEKLKSSIGKKEVWQEIVLCLKACGYEDRSEEMCKIRMYTLTTAYRCYKKNADDTDSLKKPPCFYEIDKVLNNKLTKSPRFLKSSTRINGSDEVPVALVLKNEKSLEVNNFTIVADKLLNSTNINNKVHEPSSKSIEVNQSSSKPIEVNQSSSKPFEVNQSRSKPNEVNQASYKQIEVNQSSSKPIEVNQSNSKSEDLLTKENGFRFKKLKMTQSRNDVSLEKINTSIVSFMTTRADADRKFLEKLVEYHDQEESRVLIKARQVGDLYFIEVELTLSDLTFEKLTSVLKQEFMIEDTASILITKLPNILIRNDKDVKRLKSETELEFLIIN